MQENIVAMPQPAVQPRSITVLGVTGSIGTQTANIIRQHQEQFDVSVVTAQQNADALAQQAIKLKAKRAVIGDDRHYHQLKALLEGSGIEAAAGKQALIEAARLPVDMTVIGITGFAGLPPAIAAAEAGHMLALANKECLVAAGNLFMQQVSAHGAQLIPVDSEHNAIFQVLQERDRSYVDKLVLTASGGPFRDWEIDAISEATPAQALNHPNWQMGDKITIDSATMMNKGLELIEAHYLFDMPPSQLEVVVHPQSIVHSLVALCDGSVLAQLGLPDMHTPIACALAWPERLPLNRPRLDLAEIGQLDFDAPDQQRFPCLRLAYDALQTGGASPLILNAANEVAVAAFLQERIRFGDIARCIEATMCRHSESQPDHLEEIIALDQEVRVTAEGMIRSAAM